MGYAVAVTLSVPAKPRTPNNMKNVAATSAYVRAWLPSVWKRVLQRLLHFLLRIALFPRRLLLENSGDTESAGTTHGGSVGRRRRRWLQVERIGETSQDDTEERDANGEGELCSESEQYSSAQCPMRMGLKNTGNTCFVNAVVQCLLALPGFVDRFEEEVHRVIDDECSNGSRASEKRQTWATQSSARNEKQMQLAVTLLDLLQGLLPEVEVEDAAKDVVDSTTLTPSDRPSGSSIPLRGSQTEKCGEAAEDPDQAVHVHQPRDRKRKRVFTTAPGDYSAVGTTKRLRRFLQAASKCSDLVTSEARRQDQQDAEELFLFLLDSLHELLRVEQAGSHVSDEDSSSKASQLLELTRLMELETECVQQLKTCVVTEPETYNQTVCFLGDVRWLRYLKANTSFISDMFTGQIVRGSQCCSCANLTCLHQEFRVLSLCIDTSKAAQRIEECLENHRHLEDLVEDNQVFCDGHCKDKTSRRTQVLLQRAPPILVIQLQRFKQTNWRSTAEKIGTKVTFPVSQPLNLTQNMFKRDETKPLEYKLQAVCAHIGSSMDAGHYIAYSRNARSDDWVRYDDDCVSPLNEAAFIREAETTAYMLFYIQKEATVTKWSDNM